MLTLILAAAAALSGPPSPLPPVELYHSISANPTAGLLQDAAGNLYGTTQTGPLGAGNVFRLGPDGTYTSLYDFQLGGDGGYPLSDLIMDAAGNLYGTAQSGGLHNSGIMFKLAPDGTETVLHSFSGGADGAFPAAGVAMDANGNLYGTTVDGGAACFSNTGCGTVYRITPDGVETVLHAFTCDDGCLPTAGVILDKKGNLYGTTLGWTGFDPTDGNVFEIDAHGTFKVLFTFGGLNGANPRGRLLRDKSGNLYGTTSAGGSLNCSGKGCGTVFKLSPAGSETVLYTFAGYDGLYPQAGLIADKAGNLYGTTQFGGPFSRGCGTVFRITPNSQETTLHSFYPNQYIDGCEPLGVLLRTKNGNLYGTTYAGGTGNTGTVFVVTP